MNPDHACGADIAGRMKNEGEDAPAVGRDGGESLSQRRRRLWALQFKAAPYLFILPFLLLFCCFLLYPLVLSVVMSTQQFAGPRLHRFRGLENYAFLLRDKLFWLAVANTLAFAVMFLSIQIPCSLGLALLLNSKSVRFRNLFRFAFVSPFLVGHVFVAVIFMLLLAPRHGLVNKAIGVLLPWVGSDLNWKGNPNLALPAIVLAGLWLSIGYGMVYFLAALQAVDRELYEAAEVDGAGRWGKFLHVTLPGIRPVLVFLVLVGTIGALQLFELPYLFFQGPGPGLRGLTVVQYLVMHGFDGGDLGLASAVGWVLVVFISAIAFVQLRVTGATKEL